MEAADGLSFMEESVVPFMAQLAVVGRMADLSNMIWVEAVAAQTVHPDMLLPLSQAV